MNLFFDTSLSGWDIDFSIGRNPVKTEFFGYKSILGVCWNNPEWSFSSFVQSLSDCLLPGSCPGFWTRTAVRTSVVFGLVSNFIQQGIVDPEHPIDIAVSAGDFSAPLSAWYAKALGLPVGNIICCFNECSSVWDLLYLGQLRTDGVCTHTSTSESDFWLPNGLEQMIFLCGGAEEVQRYLSACISGSIYTPEEKTLQKLRKNIYVSVASEKRLMETISGFYRTFHRVLSPYAALAYAGMQDYRVREHENKYCLILSEKSPIHDKHIIADALNCSERELDSVIF